MIIRIVLLSIFGFVGIAQAERFEYSADVNIVIPWGDSTGVRDTIFIPQHILIEDINFFIGIGTENQPFAHHILIDVFSPSRQVVRLHDWTPIEWWFYWLWYDTDRIEDGPGELEDYIGTDAYGAWEMFSFDLTNGPSLEWFLWRIEVIGTPLTNTENNDILPIEFAFYDVHPNPFNSTVSLEYGLPQPSDISFTIYDIKGNRIKTIDLGSKPSGRHTILWDGRDQSGEPVSSGTYFIRMYTGDKKITRKAVLLK